MKNYYECYSFNMMKFITDHKIEPVNVAIHKKSKKTFWIYKLDAELSEVLNKWSLGKRREVIAI